MSESQEFHYSPLDSNAFRLLTIYPDDDASAPLRCKLEHVSWAGDNNNDDETSNQPQYEALSYCWGEEGPSRPVSLNGRTFYVTPTLEEALCCIRRADRPRRIWIDAICINQDDAVEKGLQIREMHSIFSRAVQVVAWLGFATGDAELGFQFAKSLYDEGVSSEATCTLVGGMYDDWFRKRMDRLLAPALMPSWSALHRLLDMPWWRRAWVVQEVMVARTILIMCGKASIAWDEFKDAVIVAQAAYRYVEFRYKDNDGMHLANLRQCASAKDLILARRSHVQAARGNRYLGPSDRLLLTRARICKLDHDRVFSVLALLPQTFQESLEVNYDQSIDELFKTVARASILEHQDALLCSQHSAWNPHLPSFVPDWRLPERIAVFSTGIQQRSTYCRFSQDLSRLTLKGRVLARVTALDAEKHFFQGIRKLPYYGHSHNGAEIFSIGWDIDSEQFKNLLAPGFGKWSRTAFGFSPTLLNVFLKLLSTRQEAGSVRPVWHHDDMLTSIEGGDTPIGPEDCDDVKNDLRDMLVSRTLSHTTKGLAIVPDITRIGDSICWILGTPALVVLRPEVNGTGYRFIGDTFMEAREVRMQEFLSDYLVFDESECSEITLV